MFEDRKRGAMRGGGGGRDERERQRGARKSACAAVEREGERAPEAAGGSREEGSERAGRRRGRCGVRRAAEPRGEKCKRESAGEQRICCSVFTTLRAMRRYAACSMRVARKGEQQETVVCPSERYAAASADATSLPARVYATQECAMLEPRPLLFTQRRHDCFSAHHIIIITADDHTRGILRVTSPHTECASPPTLYAILSLMLPLYAARFVCDRGVSWRMECMLP